MDLYEELLGLIDLLNAEGIDYALCGGLAVVFYGYPRLTEDIDILVRNEDVERIVELVRTRNYGIDAGEIPFRTGTPQHHVIRRVSKIEGPDLLPLDLMIVSQYLEDVFRDRRTFEWKNRKVQIVSTQGLTKMKRLAGRTQDLADLERLGLAQDAEDGNQQSQ